MILLHFYLIDPFTTISLNLALRATWLTIVDKQLPFHHHHHRRIDKKKHTLTSGNARLAYKQCTKTNCDYTLKII